MTITLEDRNILKRVSLSARKTIGKKWIYYIFNGKTCVRTYVVPTYRRTKNQDKIRKRFSQLMRQWQQLPSQIKEKYKEEVKYLNLKMTAHNYFLSQRLRSD